MKVKTRRGFIAQIDKSWSEYISQDLVYSRVFGNIPEKIERRGEREREARGRATCGGELRGFARVDPSLAGLCGVPP